MIAPDGQTWAIIPTKSFDNAKSRLSSALSRQLRAKLAQDLFNHVLSCLRESVAVDQVLVVTTPDAHTVRENAAGPDTHILLDPEAVSSLNQVVDAGIAHLSTLTRPRRILIIMADLPSLNVQDIETLLEPTNSDTIAIAPDRHNLGTNALAFNTNALTKTRFGRADSFEQHKALFLLTQRPFAVIETTGLGFDLDVPDDLTALRRLNS